MLEKAISYVKFLQLQVKVIIQTEWMRNGIKKCKHENEIFALYTQAFSLEFRLCLRHPSVCTTTDPKFCAENTRICEETASKLLTYVRRLLWLKSLDTTWYQMSVYCAAMFSSLVARWERRFETASSELADECSGYGIPIQPPSLPATGMEASVSQPTSTPSSGVLPAVRLAIPVAVGGLVLSIATLLL